MRRPAARGGGSTSWQESKGDWAETREPGPQSVADLGAWPRQVAEALLKNDDKRSNFARAEVEIRVNALRIVLHRG